MIYRKELRVGNLLKHGDSVVEVEEIGDDGINILWMHEMSGWDYDYKNLYPIELTPEWLERCGFIKELGKHNIWYGELHRLKLWLENRCLCYIKNEDDEFCQYIPNGGIDYLHQLQNLFYALTGEELKITNPK